MDCIKYWLMLMYSDENQIIVVSRESRVKSQESRVVSGVRSQCLKEKEKKSPLFKGAGGRFALLLPVFIILLCKHFHFCFKKQQLLFGIMNFLFEFFFQYTCIFGVGKETEVVFP